MFSFFECSSFTFCLFVMGRWRQEDFSLSSPFKVYCDEQRLRGRVRESIHLGSIIQIPQCWILVMLGNRRRLRRGDRVRGNGVREKLKGRRPGEGAVLSQRPVALSALLKTPNVTDSEMR